MGAGPVRRTRVGGTQVGPLQGEVWGAPVVRAGEVGPPVPGKESTSGTFFGV